MPSTKTYISSWMKHAKESKTNAPKNKKNTDTKEKEKEKVDRNRKSKNRIKKHVKC